MKQAFLTGVFSALILSCGFCQGVWSVMPNTVGTLGRYGSVGFSIGNYGYVCSGYVNSVVANDLWQYEPGLDVWTQKANYPGLSAEGSFAFEINGKAYVGGGRNSNTVFSNSFCEYDPALNVWGQKNSVSLLARSYCGYFTIGTKGYITLGQGASGILIDTWEYDPATDTWLQKANFPSTKRLACFSMASNGKGYCIAGNLGMTYFNEVWSFDPALNQWIQKTSFPGYVVNPVEGFTIGNDGYIVNGLDQSSWGESWRYDPLNDSWAQIPSFGRIDLKKFSTFSVLGKGYVVAGLNTGSPSSSQPTDSVYKFDPTAVGMKNLDKGNFILTVFPNPVVEEFTILNSSPNELENLQVSLFNDLGEVVESRQFSKKVAIQRGTLPSGIYFYRISNQKGLLSSGTLVFK